MDRKAPMQAWATAGFNRSSPDRTAAELHNLALDKELLHREEAFVLLDGIEVDGIREFGFTREHRDKQHVAEEELVHRLHLVLLVETCNEAGGRMVVLGAGAFHDVELVHERRREGPLVHKPADLHIDLVRIARFQRDTANPLDIVYAELGPQGRTFRGGRQCGHRRKFRNGIGFLDREAPRGIEFRLHVVEVGVQRELLVRVSRILHHLLHTGGATQRVLGGIEVFGPAHFAAVEHLHDMRLRMHEAGFLRLVVDHRGEYAVRGHTFHERLHHLGGKQEVLFAEEFRVAVDALEFLHERGVGAEARNRLLVNGLVACDNDDIGFLRRLVEAHVRERDIERFQYVQEQLVVELVGLYPLHP